MTPLQQLKMIMHEQYISEEGERYSVQLKPGLNNQQVQKMGASLPGHLPGEIADLLRFTSGFGFYGMEDIVFDAVNVSGFKNIFPWSVQLTGDGLGNFWVVDIHSTGAWGAVFYVCHDPAVIVKHSRNLAQFIRHIHEYGMEEGASHMARITEQIVPEIWRERSGYQPQTEAARTGDATLKQFAATLPETFLLADLRHQPNGAGFAWGRYDKRLDSTVRYGDELIWAVELKKKKSFFGKLFGSGSR